MLTHSSVTSVQLSNRLPVASQAMQPPAQSPAPPPESQLSVQARQLHQAHEAQQQAQLARPLTQDESKKLMLPLLKLRQAACHPQVRIGRVLSRALFL